MPWQNSNDHHAFNEEEILRHALPASGVYGLFNLRHQIFIGSSSNIQEALLHHLKQLKPRYKRFEPTRFLFEGVPAEWRELRMFELIFEYDPVIKPDKDIGLAQLWRSWINPDSRAFESEIVAKNEPAKEHYDMVSPPAQGWRFLPGLLIHRTKLIGIAIILGLTILIIGGIRVGTGQHFFTTTISRYVKFFKDSLVSVVRRNDGPDTVPSNQKTLREGSPAQTAAETSVVKNAERTPPAQEKQIAVVTKTPKLAMPAVTASATLAPKVVASPSRMTQPEISPNAVRTPMPIRWSVQTLATTNQSDANALVDRLKSKNYDAVTVQVVLKGQTWFRVRVGDFNTYPEAEALQNSLRSKEGLSDAFAFSNAK